MLCLKERGNLVAQAIALDVMATIGDHTLQSLNVSMFSVFAMCSVFAFSKLWSFLNCGAK